jgi:hypothetical protein
MPTALEKTLLLVGFAFLGLSLLAGAVGLSPWLGTAISGVALVAFVAMFVVRWRRRRAALSPCTPVNRAQPVALRLLPLLVLVAVTLSGPWWLPYVGIHLAFRQLTFVAIVACILSVAIYLFGWWYSTRKT